MCGVGHLLAHGQEHSHQHCRHHDHGKHDEPAKTDESDKVEALCPVSGDKIDKKVFVDGDAGRVYYCCSFCIKKYQSNTGKYAAAVHAQQMLLGLPLVQVSCPVSGRALDKSVFVDHYGQKVYFCCNRCPEQFNENSGQYLSNVSRAFTTQTKCPVSGKEIDPKASISLADGVRVYFCCERCPSQFEGDRHMYGAKLPNFYICSIKECKDTGSLNAGECPKCGKAPKNIGQSAMKIEEPQEGKVKRGDARGMQDK